MKAGNSLLLPLLRRDFNFRNYRIVLMSPVVELSPIRFLILMGVFRLYSYFRMYIRSYCGNSGYRQHPISAYILVTQLYRYVSTFLPLAGACIVIAFSRATSATGNHHKHQNVNKTELPCPLIVNGYKRELLRPNLFYFLVTEHPPHLPVPHFQ